MNTINVSPQKKRIEYVDLAKGFCILLVVYNHACQAFGIDDNTFNNVLGSFRMPLYFILSGLFFKEYKDLIDFSIRKVNKLIIPFASFYVLFSILLPATLDFIDGKFTIARFGHYCIGWLGSVFFNQATWFLLALFFTNIIFYLIKIISNKVKYPITTNILLSIFAGAIGVMLGHYRINIPLFIDTSLSAVPYFCFGYILCTHTDVLYPNRYDRYNIVIIILLIFFFLIPFYEGRVCALISNHFYINPLYVYLCGIAGTMVVLLTCKSIYKTMERLSWFTYIGRYSIMILLTHQVILKVIKRYWINIFPNEILGSILCFVFTMAICTCLIPLMKKYIPMFTAQEDFVKLNRLI